MGRFADIAWVNVLAGLWPVIAVCVVFWGLKRREQRGEKEPVAKAIALMGAVVCTALLLVNMVIAISRTQA
jgi:hypothetical protein